MNFNFKNKNLTIILLLILVLGSIFCYNVMHKTIENFDTCQENMIGNKLVLGGGANNTFYQLLNLGSVRGYVSDPSNDIINPTHNTLIDNSFNIYIKYFTPHDLDLSYNGAGTFNNDSLTTNLTLKLYSLQTEDPSNNFMMNFDLSSDNQTLLDISGNPFTGLSIMIDSSYVVTDGIILEACPNDSLDMAALQARVAALEAGADGAEADGTETAFGSGVGGNLTIGDIITKLNSENKGNNNVGSNNVGSNTGSSMPENQFMPDYVNNLQNSGYMLQQPGLLDTLANSEYKSPHYNEFETAMNLPSDPIINPMNGKNPLEDSQSLFGPSVTDMNFKNSMLNNLSDLDPNNKCDKKNDNNNDNGNGNNNGNNNGNDSCPPCPPPQRCPESSFECKKVPNYEMGKSNAFLPRPVLSDFSTFGM